MTTNLKAITASKSDLEREVGERKQAEVALRESELKYSLLFKRAAVAASLTKLPENAFADVNEAFEKLFGYTRQEVVGKTSRELGIAKPEEHAVTVVEIGERGLQHDVEKHVRTKSGVERIVLLNVNELELGGQRYAISTMQDITERKHLDQMLRQTNERLDMAQRASGAGTWDWNILTSQLIWSPELFDLFGLDPQKSVASFEAWDSALHPEDRKIANSRINQALKEHTNLDSEYRIMRPDGQIRWINALGRGTYDDQGRPVRMIGICIDITERKRVEERMAYQANLLTNITDIIYSTDEQLRLTSWNHVAEEVYGWKEEEVLGRNVVEVTGSKFDPEMRSRLASALAETGSLTKEIEHMTRSGKSLIFESKTMPMRNTSGKVVGFVAVNRDITERKRAEQALQKANDELEQRVQERTAELSDAKENTEAINEELQVEISEHENTEKNLLKAKEAAEAAVEAKAAFLANMSHEIRTPMNSILGFTELLLDEPLSPEQKDNLEIIRINGDALLTIINDILDFSKMESDKAVLEEQAFNLRQCVEESLDLVALQASEKGLNLAYTIDKDVPDTIISDPGRLRQVLGNLLSNAVKFTDKGEVTLSVSSQQFNGIDEVHFAVQDTGIGIPLDRMNLLFQPFSQMEPSTTRLYGGTGLGLAISRKLVELMGGRIWAESEKGKGSTFNFTIKASSVQSDPQPARASHQLVGKRVLIVSDNKTNRRILSKQVYEWSMIPMVTLSGMEALNWVRRGDDFDIAILDAEMQETDGLKLEKEIHKYNTNLPLVLLTSLGKHIPSNNACLTKPIKPSQLHKVLTETLSRQSLQRPASPSTVSQPAQINPLRILLAEDNMSSQKVALQMLKRLGYKADTVANGIEALQSLERKHYDVVLMDVRMPEMDGLEATRLIRQHWPDKGPKVIAITAYAIDGDREKCLEAGMDDYIAKPVKMDELKAALEKNSIGEKATGQ